jgi:aminoglycoside 6'-N-acetyltransferase I
VMRQDLWPDASLAEHEAEIHEVLASPRHLALLAHRGDEVAGFAEASIRHDYVNGCDTSPVAFLEGIYVGAAHRRAGLAAGLCAQVAAWGQARGCTELASDTDWDNPEGIAFHLGAGFEESERVVYFRKLIG